MGEHHPGVMETPMSKRDDLERQAGWSRERVHLAHAAVKVAEHDHRQALAALEDHVAGEGR